MSSLDEIGIKYNTDKSSVSHDYLRHYEEVLSPYKNEPVTIMELGVGAVSNLGKSVFTWREYFTNASIVGIDKKEISRNVAGERLSIEIGDCGNPDFLSTVAMKYQPDIIIDDASHKWSHQILSFEYMFPHLKDGGIFIMEDLGTSFEPYNEMPRYADNYEDAATYFSKLFMLVVGINKKHFSYDKYKPNASLVNLAARVDWIRTSGELLFIKKSGG